MTIGVTARLTVKPDCIAAFETAFAGYQRTVRATEPGNLLFQLHRDPANPGRYLVMERYADGAALDAHRNSEHYRRIPAVFGAMMAGPPVIEVFEAVP